MARLLQRQGTSVHSGKRSNVQLSYCVLCGCNRVSGAREVPHWEAVYNEALMLLGSGRVP